MESLRLLAKEISDWQLTNQISTKKYIAVHFSSYQFN